MIKGFSIVYNTLCRKLISLKDKRLKKIFLTGSSTTISKGFSLALSFIAVPLTLKYLGDERYGLWMSISAGLVVMSFADLGLGNGLLNAISRSDGKSDKLIAQKATSSTFFLLLFLSFGLLTLTLIVYKNFDISKIFNVSTELAKRETGPTFLVLAILLIVNLPIGIFQRILEGYQEGYKYQLFLLMGNLVGFGLLFLGIYLQFGMPFLVFSISVGNLIAGILAGIYLLLYSRKELIPRWSLFEYAKAIKLFKFGFCFLALQILSFLNVGIDNILIANKFDPTFVPNFEIVRKLFSATLVLNFFIAPLWPAFSEALESKDYKWAEKTFYKVLLYSSAIGVFATLPFLVFGRILIEMWVGVEYVPSNTLLLGFYLFSFIANFGGVMSTFLSTETFVKTQLILVCVATFATLFCKMYFLEKLGIDYLIWANVFCFSVLFILPSMVIVRRFFKEVSI